MWHRHPFSLATALRGHEFIGAEDPVAAYGLRLPDASTGATAAGPFAGNNVYSSSGVGETRDARVQRGSRVTSYVKIQNDGLVAASFDIKGTGGAHGITARYYRGRTNITAKVEAGTYSTASLAPGASVVLRVVIRAATSSAAQATFLTTARSQAGTPGDAVRLVVKASGWALGRRRIGGRAGRRYGSLFPRPRPRRGR